MRFCYVHFPKAGGTSLRVQIDEQFPGKTLADYAHNPIGGEEVRVETHLPVEFPGVFGHFHPLRYFAWIDVIFTVLREPIRNIISIYHFWKDFPATGNAVHDRFLHENPDIVEFAKNYPLKTLMSEAYFGDFDMNCFDFVGFHENREDSFKSISNLLGVPLSHDFHINKTDDKHDDNRSAIVADSRTISELRDALKDDLKFYDNMRSKWL